MSDLQPREDWERSYREAKRRRLDRFLSLPGAVPRPEEERRDARDRRRVDEIVARLDAVLGEDRPEPPEPSD